ncbi:hypothetical protein [Crocosphaera sp.]|uniref:dCTP deaminase domain-containing protein n=1 Tax=Crocosphaera sp. TaxID=2729996 RepID=UPI002601E1DD|nr:hypothetical protein [Crocosphaera sp.]MDJ0581019.1 hypothetical protein [Crocosphaera sp.]
MPILTDTDIQKILCTEENQWNRETQLLIKKYNEDCLTSMGYDLRVGGFMKSFITKPSLTTLNEGEQLLIKPRDIALIGTLEEIKMPQNGCISALILSKVSKVALGLSHISTKVDPGWAEGELLIPVQNFSSESIKLDYGETFCTIIFLRNESPPQSLYNSEGSRSKFVKLLAQVRKKSLWQIAKLEIMEGIIIFLFLAAGLIINAHFEYNINIIIIALVTVGIAMAKIVRNIVDLYTGTK